MNTAGGDTGEVAAYIEALGPEQRALFERLRHLVLAAHPDVEISMAYDMPAYRVGRRRLSLGAWSHGISVYGWRRDNDGGFLARHPELLHGKSTLRIAPDDAASIDDDEFRALLGGALEPED